tara:strand:+ start:494 stop:919 length:426 start_codon:yes stop_codon:yes gene_type:complete
MSTLEEERETWTVYSNLHILGLGGVPASKDMQTFAPNLWKEQTATPATYFVWSDSEIGSDEYIKQTKSIGHFEQVFERTDAAPDEKSRTVGEELEMDELAQRCELWAKARERIRSWNPFDTSGLSCHGIVPRPPMDAFAGS